MDECCDFLTTELEGVTYRLSYSMQSENNMLKYEYIANGLTETTTVLTADSAIYMTTIKSPEKVITIRYEAYPNIIAWTDTMFIQNGQK